MAGRGATTVPFTTKLTDFDDALIKRDICTREQCLLAKGMDEEQVLDLLVHEDVTREMAKLDEAARTAHTAEGRRLKETVGEHEEVLRGAEQALDRALRYERIVTHDGYVPEYWVAYYDMFERPDPLPPLALGVLDFWWFNQEKYEALKTAGALK